MRQPHQWKRREEITAAKLQSMTDAIKELQNFIRGRAKTGGPRPTKTPPPFYPVSISRVPDSDPAEYEVRFKRGVVIDTLTERGLSDCIEEYVPQMEVDDGGGGTIWVDMDAEDAVLIVPVDDYVYCHFETDEFGVIDSGEPNFPRIESSASDEVSTHYQPEDDVNSPVDGDYWRKLFRINADGNSYTLEFFQQSDIEHGHDLPTFENLGDGKEIFKQRDADKYEFLGLTGNIDTEPGSSFTEADVLIDRDGAVDLASATNNRVRVFIDNADLGGSHPWKATENGTEFINIEAGNIQGFKTNGSASGTAPSVAANFFAPFWTIAVKYAGGSIEVTDNGYIYAKVDFTNMVEGSEGAGSDLEISADLYRPTDAVSLYFSDVSPDTFDPNTHDFGDVHDAYFLIAEVSLDDGEATVDYQYLTHNPIVQLDSIVFTYLPPS